MSMDLVVTMCLYHRQFEPFFDQPSDQRVRPYSTRGFYIDRRFESELHRLVELERGRNGPPIL